MKEKSRQFIVFGNFREVSKNDISDKLSGLIEELKLDINMSQDMFTISPRGPIMRPVLQDKSRQISIYFGLDRVCYEWDMSSLNSYDDFASEATRVVKHIIDALGLTATRLACCGSLIHFEPEKNHRLYAKIFNPDIFFYNEDSIEWDFMTNDQVQSESLNCAINQVIRIISGINIVGIDGTSAGQLVIAYDYNTEFIGAGGVSSEKIDTFVELAKDFRNKVEAL